MKKSGEDNNASSKQKYYVISYKWWELWKFYINYSFYQKNELPKQSIEEKSNSWQIVFLFHLENGISKKASNISLLDIGSSIPSEMKEAHSVTRKIEKTNMVLANSY